jgi:CMP-N,N'-diacetyllegionaminic acid synthase
VPRKNVKLLGGQPLIAWTIAAAKLSGVFTEIGVSTDDDETCQIAWDLGVKTWRRPAALAQDDSPDIEWVREVFKDPTVQDAHAFAILRPTSPFRTDATIQRAYRQFKRQEVHSIRAVEPVKQHPGKMWTVESVSALDWPGLAREDISIRTYEAPWHSCRRRYCRRSTSRTPASKWRGPTS